MLGLLVEQKNIKKGLVLCTQNKSYKKALWISEDADYKESAPPTVDIEPIFLHKKSLKDKNSQDLNNYYFLL